MFSFKKIGWINIEIFIDTHKKCGLFQIQTNICSVIWEGKTNDSQGLITVDLFQSHQKQRKSQKLRDEYIHVTWPL